MAQSKHTFTPGPWAMHPTEARVDAFRAELSSNPAKEPTLRMDIAYRIARAAIAKAMTGGAS